MSTSRNWFFRLFKKSSVTVENIEGSTITVHTGDINDIPSEQVSILAEELGITKSALKNFFKILQKQNIAPEDYDHTLRQIAERHNSLLKELADFQADDPVVKSLLKQAEQVLEQGEFGLAEDLINQASEKDLQVAEQLLETAHKRFVSAAEAKSRGCGLNIMFQTAWYPTPT